MVSVKRWWVALTVVALLLAGTAAAWMYFVDRSPKNPIRARQVMAVGLGPVAVSPRGPAHNNRQGIITPAVVQTMERTTQSNHKGAE
jgi:hypothetical protein